MNEQYCRHHQDKKIYGLGLCRNCYDRERKWKSRGINITTEEYFALLNKQNGTCLFCDRKQGKKRLLDVDHDHKTTKVRGLLCNEHNRVVGVIEKYKDIVPAILKYIQ